MNSQDELAEQLEKLRAENQELLKQRDNAMKEIIRLQAKLTSAIMRIDNVGSRPN